MTAYIYITGTYVEIDKTLVGVCIKDAIDETLDSGTLITESTAFTFELWQSVKIVDGAISKYFMISDINKEQLKSGIYRYILSLIEPTKYLEKFIISFASTNKNITLKEQIDRLLNNVEILKVGDTVRFTQSSNLVDFLGTTAGEDFTFEKQTLRECLDAMLSIKKSRCEVLEITDFYNIVIYYYNIQPQDATIVNLSSTEKNVEVINAELLGTDIEVNVINTFTGDRDTIYHPSPFGWDTFKTNEAILTSSNATIRAAFPIEEIKSFIVKTHFTADYFISDTEKYHTYQSQEIDMIRNVVSKEIWDILPTGNLVSDNNLVITDTLYKANTIYYIRGETNIASKEVKYNLFFSASSFQVALRNAIYILKKDDIQSDLEEPPAPYTLYNIISYGGYNVADYDDALFRIGYQPYIDAHARIGKRDFREIKSTIINSQTDKIVDLKRLGILVSENINRFGNEELTLDTIHLSLSIAGNVGDIISTGHIITDRQISFMNGYLKCQYKLSKNYAAINHRIGIDRRKQIYSIPLENFKVDLLFKYVVYFGKTVVSSTDETNLMNGILKTLSKYDANTPITNTLVRTSISDDGDLTSIETFAAQEASGDISPCYELPIVDYQIASSNLFSFKFQDNYSAGMSNVGEVIGGVKTTPNPYVNSIGEYYQIYFRLFSDNEGITRSTNYDDVKLLPKTDESYYPSNQIIFGKVIEYIKDRYEYHSMTIQIEYLSEDEDIIIGDAFAEHNGLINADKETFTFYCSTRELYSKGDTNPRGGQREYTSTYTQYYIGISCTDMEAMNSWCLADSKGNIVIACNHKKNGATSYIYAKCVYER